VTPGGSNIELRALTPDDADACDAIIASLPYFFGDPQGVEDCARAVRSQAGILALADGAPAGFLTWEQHFAGGVELTWMAVDAARRRRGIGARLIAALDERMRAAGVTMICVLTLGPSVPEPKDDDNYEGTRRFYRANGFVPLRELQLSTWNNSHALMLARPVAATG
jgi:GNAT superfamily N-acetyltransferase